MFGFLNPEMLKVLAPYVEGKHIWDLGSGSKAPYSHLLAGRFDVTVTAIDKEPMPPSTSKVKMVSAYFVDVAPPPEGLEVAFVSWPVNYRTPGLGRWLRASKVIVYLGCNTDGSACGDVGLFLTLVQREVLVCVPSPRNSMVVYGPRKREGPGLTGEEYAALGDRRISFTEAWSQ